MARIGRRNYIGLCIYMLANVQTLRTAELRQAASIQVPRKRKEEINEPTNLHEVKIAINTKLKDDVNPQCSDILKRGRYR